MNLYELSNRFWQENEYEPFSVSEVALYFYLLHRANSRRLAHYKDGDEKFSPLPDVLLIDGGVGQVAMAVQAMEEQGYPDIPVFGMVKDDRHRTRALITPEGREIGIQANPAVFAFIGNIQEETHRFAIEYHRTLRSKRVRASRLDGIPGVGEKRKAELLKRFKSVKAIAEADLIDLAGVIPGPAAKAVYDHFHSEESNEVTDHESDHGLGQGPEAENS